MASTTFSGPVTSAAGFTGAITGNATTATTATSVATGASGTITIRSLLVSALPAAAAGNAGQIFMVTNATVVAPAIILVYSSGAAWLRVDTGLAVV